MKRNLLKSLSDFEDDKHDGTASVGYGAYSTVRRVKCKATGELYALKEINMGTIHPKDVQNINREVKNHMKLDHPNVIQFYGYLRTPNNFLYLLLEYAENGNLFHYIRKNHP